MQKRMPDEGAANEADLSLRKTFNTQKYIFMIDSLLAKLEKRMKANNNICKTFGFYSELTSLSCKQIQDNTNPIASSYPCDLEDALVVEN